MASFRTAIARLAKRERTLKRAWAKIPPNGQTTREQSARLAMARRHVADAQSIALRYVYCTFPGEWSACTPGYCAPGGGCVSVYAADRVANEWMRHFGY